MKRIGIIGAGRFGSALAENLAEQSVEVLLIDKNRETIQELSEYVTRAFEGDSTNLRTLEDAGFHECDVVVIAIGSNLEGSIMATVNCRELGVPKVVAKANSDLHGKILKRVGADEVVYPNRDRAKRLAHTLTARGTVDFFEIADGYSLAEIDVPKGLVNRSLEQAEVRKKHKVTILCIRRLSDDPTAPRTLIMPTAHEIMHPDDKLLIFGGNDEISDIMQAN